MSRAGGAAAALSATGAALLVAGGLAVGVLAPQPLGGPLGTAAAAVDVPVPAAGAALVCPGAPVAPVAATGTAGTTGTTGGRRGAAPPPRRARPRACSWPAAARR
ncbi:hypothetical protein [Quadrisphaera sp. INWT6]|uniref:hypothetical protein n=1 Tax=Quadrisphaera sp. INWT6 TaxID=2596917 RepID=UPI001891FDB3|nr:hypothetical protein [Quadrisphaera sp. INWT6]MBF5081435.1 hypothetical protein [Quadrisphaera sp. INWT6]